MYVRGYLQGSENGRVVTIADWMRLDSALKKSRPQYISAQKISTLFDEIAR